MDLTEHQDKTLRDLLECPDKVVALVGSAGVGKSYTISEFVKDNKYDVAVTGTTHRAVANVTDMTGLPGKTIHSFLGFTMVNKGAQTFLKPRKGFTPDFTIKYLIIDEMSMLTNQLMARIEEYIELAPKLEKVILIGDPIQLRLPGSIKLEDIKSFELKEQMRQTGAPNVAAALSKIRTAIENKTELQEAFTEGDDFVVYEEHYDFLKAYKACENEKMILMFQNKTVKAYNDNVKKYLLEDENRFSVGDIIYPTSPIIRDKKVRITNRQVVEITKVVEEEAHYDLYTDFGMIKVTKSKQVFNDYLQSLADNKEWKEFYELKDVFADVHHVWAGTSHSAQGMSVEEIFIDFTDIQLALDRGGINDMYRLLYVAMSRCRSKVNIYIGNDRVYKALGKYTKRI